MVVAWQPLTRSSVADHHSIVDFTPMGYFNDIPKFSNFAVLVKLDAVWAVEPIPFLGVVGVIHELQPRVHDDGTDREELVVPDWCW